MTCLRDLKEGEHHARHTGAEAHHLLHSDGRQAGRRTSAHSQWPEEYIHRAGSRHRRKRSEEGDPTGRITS
jgi:hypothetical protein